jgi:hypothetical protein
MERRTLTIIDLNAELAKLTMFRRTPQSTAVDRKGSVARLASYRDGLLLGHQGLGGKTIGNAISPATSSFTSLTALRHWKSCATTGCPSLLRFAPE